MIEGLSGGFIAVRSEAEDLLNFLRGSLWDSQMLSIGCQMILDDSEIYRHLGLLELLCGIKNKYLSMKHSNMKDFIKINWRSFKQRIFLTNQF